MPQGQDLDGPVLMKRVVEEVAGAREEEAPCVWEGATGNGLPGAREFCEELEGRLDVFNEGERRLRTILNPPVVCSRYLLSCSWAEPNAVRQGRVRARSSATS